MILLSAFLAFSAAYLFIHLNLNTYHLALNNHSANPTARNLADCIYLVQEIDRLCKIIGVFLKANMVYYA